jgi:hypothetical protein
MAREIITVSREMYASSAKWLVHGCLGIEYIYYIYALRSLEPWIVYGADLIM